MAVRAAKLTGKGINAPHLLTLYFPIYNEPGASQWLPHEKAQSARPADRRGRASSAHQSLTPNRAATNTVNPYSRTVSPHDAIRASQNAIPCRSMAGNARNMGSDGSTYQKVASA
jgi:hypothetical protein